MVRDVRDGLSLLGEGYLTHSQFVVSLNTEWMIVPGGIRRFVMYSTFVKYKIPTLLNAPR